MVWVAETVGEDGRSGVRWVGYVAWGVVRRISEKWVTDIQRFRITYID